MPQIPFVTSSHCLVLWMASASHSLHHSHSIIDHALRTYGSSQAFHSPTRLSHKPAVLKVRAQIFMQHPSIRLAIGGGAIRGQPTWPPPTAGHYIHERQRNIHLLIYRIIPLPQAQSHPSRVPCLSQLREPSSLSPSLTPPLQMIMYMMEGCRLPILPLRRSSGWNYKVTSEVQ